MSILSFLLLLSVVPNSASDLSTTSSILPPPHFSNDRVIGTLPDVFSESEPPENSPLFVGEISESEYLASTISDGPKESRLASTETTDQAVPDPPTNFSAGPPTGIYHIGMSWSVPANDGGSPITGYKIEWSTDGGTNWEVLVEDTQTTGIRYDLYSSRLTPGGTFHFRVRALNADGESDPSNVSFTTAVATSGPGSPTNVRVIKTSSDAAQISWNAPTDLPGGNQVYFYSLFRTDDNGNFLTRIVRALPATSLTYTDNNVQIGKTYGYVILSDYGVNQFITRSSNFSDPIFIAFTDPPGAPTALRAAAGSGTTDLSWTAPSEDGGSAITGYKVEALSLTVPGSSWITLKDDTESTTTTYSHDHTTTDAGQVWLGQARQYRVSAISLAGTGPPTPPLLLTGRPDNLIITSGSPTRVSLKWTAPAASPLRITGYRIEVSPNGTDQWTTVGPNTSFTTTETSYTHTGLALETEYHYRVFAISRQAGESVHPSNVIRIATGPSVTPNPPPGVTAIVGTDRSATVTWTAPYDGGSPITGYEVNYNFSGERDYIWNLQPRVGEAVRSFTHTDLVVDSTYRYFVRAINAKGESSRSEIARARITGTVSAPTAPQSLTATAGGHTIINLRWAAPESHGGSLVTGYKIEVSTDGTSFMDLVANTMSTATFYQHTGLSRGDERHYRITAITDRFPVGAVSEVVRGETGPPPAITAPGAPTSLTATASGETTINLSWTAPTSTGGSPITGYLIEISTDGGTTFGPLVPSHPTTSYSHTGLTAGTTRHYRVRAINNVDTSTPSDVATATTSAQATATAPGAPTSLTATADGQTTINLSWTAPTSTGGAAITGYQIEVSPTGTGDTWTDLEENTNSTATSYAHTGLTAATTRHYRVRAINSVNPGDPSNVVTATTADAASPTAPGAPTSLTATASGQTIINLSWTVPASNGGAAITGYTLEVSTDGGTTFTPLVASQLATTYAHTGLSAGVTRHYRVRAINSATLSGAWSNVVNATTASSGGGGGGGGGGGTSLPALTFAVASASVDEAAGTYRVQVTLSASSSTATTLNYTLSGTATQDTDYTIQSSVTLGVNATSIEIPVVIVDDEQEEPDETILVTLVRSSGYTLGSITAFTLTITDNDGTTVSFAQTLSDQSYHVGVPIQKNLTFPAAQQGTPPYRYALTPELPKGLAFDASTRILSGTPTEAVAAKTYTYTVTDANANSAMQQFTLAVVQPEALTFTETIGAQRVPVQIPIPDQILPGAAGGVAPYTYTLTPELPEGLTFDPSTRALRGTPTKVASTQTYTYVVEDRAGTQTQQTFDLEVYQMSFTERVPDQSYARGEPIADLILPEATGGVSPIAYTLNLLELPLGLQFDLPTRTIRGIPTEMTPPISLTYRAVDANQAQDSLKFTMEVVSPVSTEAASGRPQEFRVYPNYPNPFQRSTHLVLDLPWPAQVRVDVLDITGRRVMAIPAADLSAGWNHEIELTGLELSSGTYLYRIQATSMDDPSSSVYVGQFVRVK